MSKNISYYLMNSNKWVSWELRFQPARKRWGVYGYTRLGRKVYVGWHEGPICVTKPKFVRGKTDIVRCEWWGEIAAPNKRVFMWEPYVGSADAAWLDRQGIDGAVCCVIP